MTFTAPWELGVVESASAIRKGELSPTELVESLLERCALIDPDVRAWVTIDGDRALDTARELTERYAGGRGTLFGIAVGLKDVFYTAGLRTTASSRSLDDFVPDHDAAAVERLRAADAIVLGKLHTAEFACADAPPTRNPWNLAHTPGGSSSGSGAAVAAGMVPFALGTQTVGSTLRPAAFNGVVGLKPTYGLVSNFGVIPLGWSFDHVGILARSVADTTAVLRELAGPDSRDPVTEPDSLQRIGEVRPDRVNPPRIGLVREFFLETCEPDVLDNLERTVERLTDEGAVVDEVSLPKSFPKISSTLTTILTVETATYHRDAYATKRDLYGARIGALVQEGARVPGVDYVAARQLRPSLVADLEHCLDGFDTLLTPTAPAVAPRNPTVTTGDASFLAPFSFAGLPAISLPTGVNHWGLPFGVQLVGRRWADFDLLAVAAWCEARIAFSARPPLW